MRAKTLKISSVQFSVGKVAKAMNEACIRTDNCPGAFKYSLKMVRCGIKTRLDVPHAPSYPLVRGTEFGLDAQSDCKPLQTIVL